MEFWTCYMYCVDYQQTKKSTVFIRCVMIGLKCQKFCPKWVMFWRMGQKFCPKQRQHFRQKSKMLSLCDVERISSVMVSF